MGDIREPIRKAIRPGPGRLGCGNLRLIPAARLDA
jgi:hypothetical protein